MNDDRNETDSGRLGGGPGFVAGLLLGGLLGATVAMILAPAAGGETRDLLRSKAREASGRARDAAEDLTKTSQTVAGGLSTSASDLLSRGKQIVEEARARFDGAVSEGKDAAAEQRSTLDNET
jgi:gas vesicle protein